MENNFYWSLLQCVIQAAPMWIWRCILRPIQHFKIIFKGLIDTLEVPFLHNVTTQEHILPISLQSDYFDKELLAAPEDIKKISRKIIKERN